MVAKTASAQQSVSGAVAIHQTFHRFSTYQESIVHNVVVLVFSQGAAAAAAIHAGETQAASWLVVVVVVVLGSSNLAHRMVVLGVGNKKHTVQEWLWSADADGVRMDVFVWRVAAAVVEMNAVLQQHVDACRTL